MDEEEELDMHPVKELKPKVLNEQYSSLGKPEKRKEVNFYYVNTNLPKLETNQQRILQNCNSSLKEVLSERRSRAKIPHAVWEEVSSPYLNIRQRNDKELPSPCLNIGQRNDKELPTDVHPVQVSNNIAFKISNSRNRFMNNEEKSAKPSDTSSHSNFLLSTNLKQRNDQRSLRITSHNSGNKFTLKSKSQSNVLNDDKVSKSELEDLNENSVKKNSKETLKISEFATERIEEKPREQIVMKRIHGGRIELTKKDQIRSWRKMESIASKYHVSKSVPESPRSPNGSKRKSLEETHPDENEEVHCDANSPSGQSKRQKVTKEGGNVCCKPSPDAQGKEKIVKIRHYNQESIRKFMANQKAKRKEARENEMKRKEEERERIEAHLKELQHHYKEDNPVPNHLLRKDSSPSKPNTEITPDLEGYERREVITGFYKYLKPDLQFGRAEAVVRTVQCSNNFDVEGNTKKDAATSCVDSPIGNEFQTKEYVKRSKRNGKKGNKFHSDDESVSEIVSRTLQECENKIKSGVISSEVEGNDSISDVSSSTEVKSIPLSRKERIASLNEMAQRLAKTIESEERALNHRINKLQTKISPPKTGQSSKNKCNDPIPYKKEDNGKPLSLSQIENMSVEELIARMTAMLPKTTSKIGSNHKTNSKCDSDAENRPRSKFSTETRSRGPKISQNYSQSMYNLDVGSVKPLSTSILDSTPVTRTKLHVPHLVESSIPLLSFRNENSFPKRNPKLSFVPKSFYTPLEIHAATVIQAYFRGFKVRKTTSSLLADRIRKKKYRKLIAMNAPPLVEPSIFPECLQSTTRYLDAFSKKCEGDLRKSGNVDWCHLEKELRKNSQIKLPSEKAKNFSLPKYVQPFYDLTETGDINAFIESCPSINQKMHYDYNNQENQFKKAKTTAQIDFFQHNSSIKRKDFTLIEEPLLLNCDPMSHDKETQTVLNPRLALNTKKEKPPDDKKKLTRKASDEIDIKCFYEKHKDLIDVPLSHKISEPLKDLTKYDVNVGRFTETVEQNIEYDTLPETVNHASSNYSVLYGSQSSSSINRVPLSENLISKGSENSEAISLIPASSKAINSDNAEKESSRGKSVLPDGYQMSPSNLISRVNAELVYQDTLGSALSHLQDLQNLRSISQSRERSSKLLGSFSRTHAKREELNKELQKMKEENDHLKKEKETAENQLKTRIDVERLEKEAHLRIEKLEREMRSRAERVINSATRASQPDHEVIATATAAAVGASIKAFEQFHPNFSQSKNEAVTSTPKSDESSDYSQDFVELSREETFHSRIIHDEERSSSSSGEKEVNFGGVEEHLKSDICTGNEVLITKSTADTVEESSNIKDTYRNFGSSPDSVSERIEYSEDLSKSGKSKSNEEQSAINSNSEILTARSAVSAIDGSKGANETYRNSKSSLSLSPLVPERVEFDDGHSKSFKSQNSDDDTEEIVTKLSSHNTPDHFSYTIKTDMQQGSDDEDKGSVVKTSIDAPTTLSSSNGVSEKLPLLNVTERKTLSVRTSVSEVISSIASPVSSSEALSDARKSASDSHETFKSVSISCTTESATQANIMRPLVDTSGTYSESFEPDSGTSDTSEPSLIKSKIQKTIIEIDGQTLQNSSNSESGRKGDGLDLPSSVAQSQTDTPKSSKGGALFSTLSLLESLQKEEKIRLHHQMAVFKLHEQSLVEEARLKLASLNSEGGTNVRKKQRAILLQLREQRAHIRRLIETQSLAAQQRYLIFSQHHQLLSSTTNMSNLAVNRILPSRVQSPITSRVLDLSLSSSDGLENLSSNASPFKGVGKMNLEILSGEEARVVNRQSDDKASKYTEENKENKTSDFISLKEREKSNRKEEKNKKHKEKYPKSSSPSNTKAMRRLSGGTSDSSVLEEGKTDFERKSRSAPNENSVYTSEDKVEEISPLGVHSISEKKASWSEHGFRSVIDLNNDQISSEEPTDDLDRVKKVSKKHLEQEPNDHTSRKDSYGNNFSNTFESLSNEKAKSDSEIVLSKGSFSLNRSSNETKKRKEKVRGVPFTLRFPLSPRSHLKQHRRQSSESDDSFTLSQNETASDMSDGEGKLVALREELAFRKAEAEKLKREKRKVLRERIFSQEEALRNQIATYDSYIEQTKLEIEKETRELHSTATVKPLIKKPRVAGSKKLQMQDHLSVSENSDILEESSLNESTNVDHSSILDSSVRVSENNNNNNNNNSSISSSSSRKTETDGKIEESKFTPSKSQSVDISSTLEEVYDEEDQNFVSKDDANNISDEKENLVNTLLFVDTDSDRSVNEFVDSEPSASQESSTETILYSPKKSVSLKGSESTNQAFSEKSPEIGKDEGEEYEQTFTEATDTQVSKHASENEENFGLNESSNDIVIEKKLEIFIPIIDHELPETEKDSEEGETITEDICEEIPVDNNESTSVDIEKGVSDLTKEPEITHPEIETFELDIKKKADSVADSILETLLSDSISYITELATEKEREIKELVVHVEESGDIDLKAGNLIHDSQDQSKPKLEGLKETPRVDSSKDEVLGSPSLDEDSKLEETSFVSPTAKREQEVINKPLEDVKHEKQTDLSASEWDFEGAFEIETNRDERINSPLQNDDDRGVNAEELASRLLSVQASSTEFDDVTDISETFAVSSCEGKWLEGDFWKAGEKVKSERELREEEELLNAEIARLEEIQRFKERYPNLVIREVPDKPPPPYTPPKGEVKPRETNASVSLDSPKVIEFPEPQTPSNTISVPHRLSKADLRNIASDIVNVIPTKQDVVISTVEAHLDLLYTEWQNGKDPSIIEHPSFTPRRDRDSSDEEDDTVSEANETTFQCLLFHLTRELVTEVYSLYNVPPEPVWVTSTFPHPAKPWQVVKRLTRKNLLSYVVKKVRIFMGWDPPTRRESTMMKWARKKKEHVDQVLVQEFQAEELSWTQYDEEEVHVKVQLSREIFSTLIEDTIEVIEQILQKKLSYLSND